MTIKMIIIIITKKKKKKKSWYLVATGMDSELIQGKKGQPWPAQLYPLLSAQPNKM